MMEVVPESTQDLHGVQPMDKITLKNNLISHTSNPTKLLQRIEAIRNRILKTEKSNRLAQKKLAFLEQLSVFEFGQFLIQNSGINGYWTQYMLTHPWNPLNRCKNEVEAFLLEKSPSILATQERFSIFLKENQSEVANNAKLACIPSGMMGELLYLDYADIDSIELVGIDYDQDTLKDAEELAKEKRLFQFTHFLQEDAWAMTVENEFDLISSNGLNIYEPDDERVTKLYQKFFNALKPQGKLVTSFLTPPPSGDLLCEWNMDVISREDLSLQKIIFSDILQAKWQCFRTTEQTEKQLLSVGFEKIQFIQDKANIFPTVIAVKPE